MTFDHAALGKVTYFQPVPLDSAFWSKGNGQVVRSRRSRRRATATATAAAAVAGAVAAAAAVGGGG